MTRQEVQKLLEESRQAVNTEQSHKMSEAFDHFRRTTLTPGDHNAIAVMKRIQSGPSRHLDIVCYRCKEKGHYQRDCPLPNPYNRPTNYSSRTNSTPNPTFTNVTTQASYQNPSILKECQEWQSRPWNPKDNGPFSIRCGNHPLRSSQLTTEESGYHVTQCNLITFDVGNNNRSTMECDEDPLGDEDDIEPTVSPLPEGESLQLISLPYSKARVKAPLPMYPQESARPATIQLHCKKQPEWLPHLPSYCPQTKSCYPTNPLYLTSQSTSLKVKQSLGYDNMLSLEP